MHPPVRQRLSPSKNSGRSLDERIALRFPGVARSFARFIGRLPPSSRLRKATTARIVQGSLQAFNRRDIEAVAIYFDPAVEYRPGRDWVASGLTDASYRGLEGYQRYIANVDQVWAGQNWLTPREVIDFGDRLLILADGDMRAQVSGVPLSQEFALLCTLKAGRPISAQEYYDHAEALRAVGLSG